jgi:hypothetical protein
MPSLPGRYDYSIGKEDAPETVVVSAKSDWHPCLGGCGILVTTAKCNACSEEAVRLWVKRGKK